MVTRWWRSTAWRTSAAFTAASIPERDSWQAAGDALLTQLEAETEAVRREYTASQLPTPPAQQPEPSAAPAPPSASGEFTLPDLLKVIDPLEQLGSESQLDHNLAILLHEPQGDDEGDGHDLDEVEEGNAGAQGAPDAYAWTGDVI